MACIVVTLFLYSTLNWHQKGNDLVSLVIRFKRASPFQIILNWNKILFSPMVTGLCFIIYCSPQRQHNVTQVMWHNEYLLYLIGIIYQFYAGSMIILLLSSSLLLLYVTISVSMFFLRLIPCFFCFLSMFIIPCDYNLFCWTQCNDWGFFFDIIQFGSKINEFLIVTSRPVFYKSLIVLKQHVIISYR